ncbi:MAG: hypothetical protein COA57_00415 [Flavobacteriales bacterium]|nr:DoxX family protein [Bacteroidales bacterium AH-315-I05]PCJ90048.1 MAG: hypothetical protein COA57_00415 [Flavobacteriales bacterium]
MNRYAGMFLMRMMLGLIFFMQGWGKVVTWGVDNVYEKFFAAYEETILPVFVVKFAAWHTSFGELICGFLLIIGLFRYVSYYILASILLIISFGHGLTSPIWDLQHVFFRTALLVPLLLLPKEWDKWSLDGLLKKGS